MIERGTDVAKKSQSGGEAVDGLFIPKMVYLQVSSLSRPLR